MVSPLPALWAPIRLTYSSQSLSPPNPLSTCYPCLVNCADARAVITSAVISLVPSFAAAARTLSCSTTAASLNPSTHGETEAPAEGAAEEQKPPELVYGSAEEFLH